MFEFQGLNIQDHLEENVRICADCNQDNVSWCDLKFGCYLCIECASIHKQLGAGEEDHEVKSFHLDLWTEEELKRANGNQESDKLEFYRPVYYLKPEPESLYIIKHEYIQDKYKRTLFNNDEYIDCYGIKSGMLCKKGKTNESWKQRYFTLEQGSIEFYLKRGDANPKKTLQLENVDVSIQPLPGKPYTLAISHTPQDENTRTYYAYGETNRETIEWYYSILATQYMMAVSLNELIYETKEHSKSGYIYKTGSKSKDKWRKRWITVVNGHTQYFEDETSPFPKGEFELEANDGFSVVDGVLGHKVLPPTVHAFTLVTPKRQYRFCALTEEDKQSWMQHFERVIAPKA